MHTDSCTEEYLLPQVEALLAGTLALMTGLSQTEGRCEHRDMMHAKVCANLRELSAHPEVSVPLRRVLARLLEHWSAPAGARWAPHDRHSGAHPGLLH